MKRYQKSRKVTGAIPAIVFASGIFGVACGTASAAPQGWFVRLKLENETRGWKHRSSMLGQQANAQAGFDRNDLKSLPPFSAPYLYIAFPHPDWGGRAGDYTTDFRSLTEATPSWTFEIRANPIGDKVYLRWEGDPAALKGSTLTNVATGQIIKVSDPKFITAGAPIVMTSGVQRFVWKFQKAPR